MKPKDMREKTTEELTKQIADLSGELFGLKFKRSIGQLEQISNIKKTKRNIAKINTVLREREITSGGAK